MIGILISANVQNFCMTIFLVLDVFLVLWFSTNSEGRAPSTEDPFQKDSVEFSDFLFVQLIKCSSDLQAPVKVLLKLVIWSLQNQIPCHIASAYIQRCYWGAFLIHSI